MLVIDASALVEALLMNGPVRVRVANSNLQAPELIDAEVLSVLCVWCWPTRLGRATPSRP